MPVAFSCKDHGADAGDIAPTLRSMGHDGSHQNGGGQVAIAFNWQNGGGYGNANEGLGISEEHSGPLQTAQTPAVAYDMQNDALGGELAPTLQAEGQRTGNRGAGVLSGMQVRRLTPLECERLQGFPDGWTDVPAKATRDIAPGRCVKQTVRATLVGASGRYFIATNGVEREQTSCPRAGMATGVGYELCRYVCGQRHHAEIGAIRLAGDDARGGTLYVEGHTYACDDCRAAAAEAGVVAIIFGPPPGNAADGPRYKALGNSMAVNVMRWIGERIQLVSEIRE